MYENKEEDYFIHIRTEILPFLPERIDRILEIGCGEGHTLTWVQKLKGCNWVCGVELFSDSAKIASMRLSKVIQGDIEKIELPADFNSFDVILCLDVLEHLIDPWLLIDRLDKLLKPGGVIITSIPNVRYFRVVLPLILQGKWEYQQEGTLDKTHLRFFTKSTAIRLVQSSGLEIDMIKATGLEPGRKAFYLNWFLLNIFKPFFEWQYLIRVRKPN